MIGGVLCDEEDQMIGVRNFIERGHADEITGAIICEPQDGLICNIQKGALRARYTINGKMSHGAMPLSGLNTAPAVARLIEGLHELEHKAVIELGRDEHLGWPSFTPTVIRSPSAGAAQLNVMPSESIMLVDIRTIPGQSHKDVISTLAALADRVENRVRQIYSDYDRILNLDRKRELKIKLDILTDRPCTVTDPDDPIVRAADWATRQVLKKTPIYGGVPGATDGTFLRALKDIPIVTMGAGNREVPHQVDEWIDLAQLLDIAKIYALAALYYLQTS
jgi:succinyl-diaminopimelate desuccinylase